LVSVCGHLPTARPQPQAATDASPARQGLASEGASFRTGGAPFVVGQRELSTRAAVSHNAPRIPSLGRGTSANELGQAIGAHQGTSADPCTFARPFLALTTMAGHDIIRVLGQIALAVLASTPAVASDVPGMTCAEIGSFAERVAQQKAEGVSFDDTVRRLRRSLAPNTRPPCLSWKRSFERSTAWRSSLVPARKRWVSPIRPPARSSRAQEGQRPFFANP
jgi:hypothetical protein